MNAAATPWFFLLRFWRYTSTDMLCHGAGAVGTHDAKGFSTRTSPGKDSDWLGLEPVPIPGPVTVAPRSHMSNLWRGWGLCQKKEEEGY